MHDGTAWLDVATSSGLGLTGGQADRLNGVHVRVCVSVGAGVFQDLQPPVQTDSQMPQQLALSGDACPGPPLGVAFYVQMYCPCARNWGFGSMWSTVHIWHPLGWCHQGLGLRV